MPVERHRAVLRMRRADARSPRRLITSSSVTQRWCSASSRTSDVSIGVRATSPSFDPRIFLVRLDRRVVFGERQLEAREGVHVALGHVVHHLPDRPAALAVRRFNLRLAQARAPRRAARPASSRMAAMRLPPRFGGDVGIEGERAGGKAGIVRPAKSCAHCSAHDRARGGPRPVGRSRKVYFFSSVNFFTPLA